MTRTGFSPGLSQADVTANLASPKLGHTSTTPLPEHRGTRDAMSCRNCRVSTRDCILSENTNKNVLIQKSNDSIKSAKMSFKQQTIERHLQIGHVPALGKGG